MNVDVYDTNGGKKAQLALPEQFGEQLRKDLVIRAVLSLQSRRRQPYGTKKEAGKRHSSQLSKRRRKYRGMYGHGISRTPRKIMSRSGTHFNWTGATAPNTVGGRRAHPAKPQKKLAQKLNIKERRKAVRSAIAATMQNALVVVRGHKIPQTYPFAIDSSFEALTKTKDVHKALTQLKLTEELARCEQRKVRAGRATMRNRRYRVKKGPLIVVADDCKLIAASQNIPGVEVVKVNSLNAELLAPGGAPGRLTLWSARALEKLGKEKLYC